jgi:hypothetical protein
MRSFFTDNTPVANGSIWPLTPVPQESDLRLRSRNDGEPYPISEAPRVIPGLCPIRGAPTAVEKVTPGIMSSSQYVVAGTCLTYNMESCIYNHPTGLPQPSAIPQGSSMVHKKKSETALFHDAKTRWHRVRSKRHSEPPPHTDRFAKRTANATVVLCFHQPGDRLAVVELALGNAPRSARMVRDRERAGSRARISPSSLT